MLKICAQKIHKTYNGRDLFKDLNFELSSSMRLGLVGPNGCGKSTLLKILAHEIVPDSGQVVWPKGARLGFMTQELGEEDLEKDLLTYVLEAVPDWNEFWRKWKRAVFEDDKKKLFQLSKVQQELEHKFGYNPEYQAEKILMGLGFDKDSLSRPLKIFSGGWRERAKLARVLTGGADVLFLDEPTNHLDLEAVLWLEDYLLNFKGILVFVAHDRFFLDKVSTHILVLGISKPILRPGNFTQFLSWHSQIQALAHKQAAKLHKEIEHNQAFVHRFRYKASKAKQAQSRLSKIEKLKNKLNDLNLEDRSKRLSFYWPTPQKGNKIVLSAVDVDFSYPDHKQKILSKINFNLLRGQKIAVVGPNGEGKSTLLRLIVGELSPCSGYIKLGSNIVVGYYSQHQTEILNIQNTVLQEIRRLSHPSTTEEELRSVLGLFLLGQDFWERKVKDLSGGEKSRLVLASLFLKRANFLVLDEPTNHLDLESREALIQALIQFPETLIMVAHDRYLLKEVAEENWILKNGQIEQGAYDFDSYLQKLTGNDASVDIKDQQKPLKKREISKKLKRIQAEKRNELYRRLKPLKDNYVQLEKLLEENLRQQEEMENKLADPRTYSNAEQAKALNIEYANLQDQGEELMAKLEVLEQEINRLEEEKKKLVDGF
ncbi:ATP-binding cassette domain-containing protein [Desulfovulcanus sp.]